MESYDTFITLVNKASERYIGFSGLLSEISGIDTASLSLHLSKKRTMTAPTFFKIKNAYAKAIALAPTKLKERKSKKSLLSRKKNI